jgi:hypothetical protein
MKQFIVDWNLKKNEIIKFCDKEAILDNILFFSSYNNDVISFEIHKNGFMYEISVICDGEIVHGDTLLTLIKIKRIFFFNIRKFDNHLVVEDIMYTQKK